MTKTDPYANYHKPSLALAAAFDVDHCGFDKKADADAAIEFLAAYGVKAEREDSGDLFRVYVPTFGEYFWPGEAEPTAWVDAAQYLQTGGGPV